MAGTLSVVTDFAGGMAFQSTSGSGHTMLMDAKAEVGGQDRGALPMEVVLQALSGCTGMDVVSILRKMRHEVSSYQIRVSGERSDGQPAVFTTITIEHIVRGAEIPEQAVRRAVELSATKYCSVGAMLGKAVNIVDTYQVIDDVSGATVTGAFDDK